MITGKIVSTKRSFSTEGPCKNFPHRKISTYQQLARQPKIDMLITGLINYLTNHFLCVRCHMLSLLNLTNSDLTQYRILSIR